MPMRALLALTLVASFVAAPAHAEARAEAAWTAPLSTRGRYIVDADGHRFKLKSANWHGASGTFHGSGDVDTDTDHHAGENSGRVPMCVDPPPLATIVGNLKATGINSVRLPFSSAM